jgi:aminoglycoside phosphotransferase (APT) family kinase protein
MELDDIGTLPLIARGGQADIYDYGNGKVIRVPRRPQDYDRIRYEYKVYVSLSGSSVAAPRVYELVEVNGAPSIIMERILGTSMMDQIKKQPQLIRQKAIDLANMHLGVLKMKAEVSMTNAKDQAKYCIDKSRSLTEDAKEVLLSLLGHLPGGDFLCHGDFHPGNILHRDGKDYIIDWSGATKGDIVYDIAHTYILLRVVPRAPGVSLLMHGIQKFLGKTMANIYLKTIMKSVSIDPRQLTCWVLIKAAERTFYGLPSEMKRLHTFINRYVEASSAGRITEDFYRWV